MFDRAIRTLLAAAAVVAGSAGVALAQTPRGEWMWHDGWSWGHMLFGMLMMVLFWGGVILLVVLLVRWLSGHVGHPPPSAPPGRTPLAILEERLARGEIDTAEFEERRRHLSD